jgi:hypothetical protein
MLCWFGAEKRPGRQAGDGGTRTNYRDPAEERARATRTRHAVYRKSDALTTNFMAWQLLIVRVGGSRLAVIDSTALKASVLNLHTLAKSENSVSKGLKKKPVRRGARNCF